MLSIGDNILTKTGFTPSFNYRDTIDISFNYEIGKSYNIIVYPQAEYGDKATGFTAPKIYDYTESEDVVYDDSYNLVRGVFYYNITTSGDYYIATDGSFDGFYIKYETLGDYANIILSETQSQIDEKLGNINSILATLVEGSVE
jgi:hypothetical protein